LPFLSHRYAVRAAEVLAGSPDEHNRTYAQRVAELVGFRNPERHAVAW
jgi:exonuclease SbcD